MGFLVYVSSDIHVRNCTRYEGSYEDYESRLIALVSDRLIETRSDHDNDFDSCLWRLEDIRYYILPGQFQSSMNPNPPMLNLSTMSLISQYHTLTSLSVIANCRNIGICIRLE